MIFFLKLEGAAYIQLRSIVRNLRYFLKIFINRQSPSFQTTEIFLESELILDFISTENR